MARIKLSQALGKFSSLSTERLKTELVDVLAKTKGKVRFVGAGHSWSKGAATNDTLIDMTALNRVLDLNVENGTVTAEAGIQMADLYSYLDDRGFALSNIPSSGKITL